MMVDPLLQFVIEDQHDGRTDASPEVGQIALEESSDALLAQDLASAVKSASVHPILCSLSALHHQSSPDCV